MPLLLFALMAYSQDMFQVDLASPGAKLQVLGDGYKFTEGPSSDHDGSVYFTDQPNDRIMKWSTNGTIHEWMKPCGRSNGTFFDPRGNLIACADADNQLWSIAPDKTVTVLVKDFGGKLLDGPNDVWVRSDGTLYFTDPLYERDYWKRDPKPQQAVQGVYRLSADHSTLDLVDGDLDKPNGIIGTADGKTLYVADIGAGKTYRYAVGADGALSDKHLFCEMGSDGMTLDAKGNVYLTGQGVTAFSSSGMKIWHLDLPGWTSNVTFAGKDHDLLFITCGDKVYGMKMSVRGI